MSYDLLRFSLLFRRFVIVKEHSVRPLFQERASHDFSFTTPPPNQSLEKEGANESPTRGFAKKSRAPICAGFPTLLLRQLHVPQGLAPVCAGFSSLLFCCSTPWPNAFSCGYLVAVAALVRHARVKSVRVWYPPPSLSSCSECLHATCLRTPRPCRSRFRRDAVRLARSTPPSATIVTPKIPTRCVGREE